MMTSTSSIVRSLVFAGAAALALAACGQKGEAPAPAEKSVAEEMGMGEEAPAPAPALDYAAIAAAAVAVPGRPEEDRTNDARRKPEPTLAFMEVAPGLKIFELEAGGGYYTELLSRAVGPDGSVVMQNPEEMLQYVGDDIEARLADDRRPNVRQSLSNFDALDAGDASMDLITWIWGPHELFYHPESGAMLGDPAQSFAEIYRILKPGGAFVVIDHSAEAGAPETTGNDLHRIDKAIIKNMGEEAGFTLEAEGDFLANPEDPLTIAIFDPSIRGRTDQFALRFRKPQ
jgi:predicted methyltransferase